MSVVATLVVGLDGSTTLQGRSAGVSSVQDRNVFLNRRRLVDVIIIGGNTARIEPYAKTPVPLVVISRSSKNPVRENPLAQMWNCSPADAVEKAKAIFGENIFIEGGISMINELVENNLIDQIELTVTPATGGENKIDWKLLLAKFKYTTMTQIQETKFYSAKN